MVTKRKTPAAPAADDDANLRSLLGSLVSMQRESVSIIQSLLANDEQARAAEVKYRKEQDEDKAGREMDRRKRESDDQKERRAADRRHRTFQVVIVALLGLLASGELWEFAKRVADLFVS